MSLIYSLVAKGSTILAEWSDNAGNFVTITRIILNRIGSRTASSPVAAKGPDEANSDGTFQGDSFDLTLKSPVEVNRVSYLYDGRYSFHCLNYRKTNFIYMVMSEKSAGLKVPFLFLEDLARSFKKTSGLELPQRPIALSHSQSFGPTMQYLMNKYNSMNPADVDLLGIWPEIESTRNQIKDIQNIMIENIDRVLARTEKIELLVDKTERLNAGTYEFRRQAQVLQRMSKFRKQKIIAAMIGASAAFVALVYFGVKLGI